MALPKFELEIDTATRLRHADANRENDKLWASDPNYRPRYSASTGLWILDDSFVSEKHLEERLQPNELPAGIRSHEQLFDQYSYSDVRQHYARIWLARHGRKFVEC
jgi:hypothetical protein